MKISAQSTQALDPSQQGATDPNQQSLDTIVQQLMQLSQMAEQKRQGGNPGDPSQLLQGVGNNLNQLSQASNNGQLSTDQQNQLNRILGALTQAGLIPQNNGAQQTQNQNTGTGYPQQDTYEQGKKVGGHHGHHGHHHAAPVNASQDTTQTNPDPAES